MKPLQLPKQEDVKEIDLGAILSKVVTVTQENQEALGDMVMDLAVGARCKYCQHEFSSMTDMRLRRVVFAGEHEHGCLACKARWEINNP